MIRIVFVLLIGLPFFVSVLGIENEAYAVSVDSVMFDTLIVADTLITFDTLYVEKSLAELERHDTLFLSSDSASWSVIEEDTLDLSSILIRQDSGLLLITPKIGFSDNYSSVDKTGYSVHTIPPMALQVEYFHNNFFSYGGQLVYGRNKYVNDTLSSQYEKDAIMGVAALGTFHYGTWLQDITHNRMRFGYLDLYASLAVRLDLHRNVIREPWSDDLGQFESGEVEREAFVKMRLRPIFGARYYISDRFSINIEVGKGNLGVLTSSVSWLISKPY